MSDSSPRAVSISTGVSVLGPLRRSALHSVTPSTPGSIRSSTTRSKRRRRPAASAPRGRRPRRCARAPRARGAGAISSRMCGVVFDDQDVGHGGRLLRSYGRRPDGRRRRGPAILLSPADSATPRMRRLLEQEGGGHLDDQDMATDCGHGAGCGAGGGRGPGDGGRAEQGPGRPARLRWGGAALAAPAAQRAGPLPLRRARADRDPA